MKTLITIVVSLTLTATTWALLPQGYGAAKKQASPDQAVIEKQLPSYPLATCLISGEPLDAMGEPVEHVYQGRLVRLCCGGCVKGFTKDPAAALAKLDAAVIAAQVDSYPMETCVVSGEGLDEMGEPIDFVYGTRLVRFCCKGCVKAFKKSPDTVMAKVDAALIAQQLESYPSMTCVVSGEALEEPIDQLYGTRLVRFCCKGCIKAFNKDPKGYLTKLDAMGGKQKTMLEKKMKPAKQG